MGNGATRGRAGGDETGEKEGKSRSEWEGVFQAAGELDDFKLAFDSLKSPTQNGVSRDKFAEFFDISGLEFPARISSLSRQQILAGFGFRLFRVFFDDGDSISWNDFLQLFATCKLSTTEEKLKLLLLLVHRDLGESQFLKNDPNSEPKVQNSKTKGEDIKMRLTNKFSMMEEGVVSADDVFCLFVASWIMSAYNSIDCGDSTCLGNEKTESQEDEKIDENVNEKSGDTELNESSSCCSIKDGGLDPGEWKSLNDVTNMVSLLEFVKEFSRPNPTSQSNPESRTGSSLSEKNCTVQGIEFDKIPCKVFCLFILKHFSAIPEILPNYLFKKILSFQKTSQVNPDYLCLAILPRGLMTRGIAWSMALTQTGKLKQLLFDFSFTKESLKRYDLLYKASLQGRGIKNLLSNSEGYSSTVVILISFTLPKDNDALEGSKNDSTKGYPNDATSKQNKFLVGALLPDGIANNDKFYGSLSTCLFSFYPKFSIFKTIGKEKNFAFFHSCLPGSVYKSVSKIEGFGFGGNSEKMRLFMDKDFEKIKISHHVYDKTFSPGGFLPNQGYKEVEGSIDDVEIWAFGGIEALEKLQFFQKRESIFTEQRGKIDLKKFVGNWEESPDKAILDLVSNPIEPSKQER